VRYGICAVLLLAACTADNPLYVGEGDGGGATQSDGGARDQAACPP